MSKQAECEYARNCDQQFLFAKPYIDPRTFREFTLALGLFIERLPGGSILDIGCGPGWTSLLLGRAGYDVLGVDISDRMIEVARERSQRENVAVEFAVADMEELNVPRTGFDGVLFFDSLHHCPAYPRALQRAADHLRPGGYIVLFETTWLHRYSPHAREESRKHGVTELGFSRKQLRRGLAGAGFEGITFFHDPGPCYRGMRGLLKTALRVCFDFAFCYPQAKNIVVGRKR
jgi:SAM-dependent methyltransferase